MQVAAALPTHLKPLKLFAYAQLHSDFDFNCTPLAPPGTKIIIHNKPAIRGSCATLGYEGWYIGPASNHYRCHTVNANHTTHERVADTVKFFPHYGKMPYQSSTENATISARELMHALQNTTPTSPFSNIGDKQMEALRQIAELFQQAVTKNNNTPTPSHLPPSHKRDKRHNHISRRHFKNMTRTHIDPTLSRTTTAINLRNFHTKIHC